MFTSHARVRVVAAALLLALPGSGYAPDWLSINGDVQNTSLSPSRLSPTTLTRTWTSPEEYHTPLIIGDQVIAAKFGRNVGDTVKITSFDLATGTKNWEDSWTVQSGSASQPAYSIASGGGLLAVTSNTVVNNIVQGKMLVYDATTGQQRYTVPLPYLSSAVVSISTDLPGGPVAYVTGGSGYTSAVRLGATSADVLWQNQSGTNRGNLAVAGGLLITASPTQYYAMDRTTGAVNHFYTGPVTGGGGPVPVVDEARQQFYLLDPYVSPGPNRLSAYSYADNQITLLWQKTGTGLNTRNSVALGPTGLIYSAEGSTLLEIDPETGATVRSITNGVFATGAVPIISDGYLWEFGKGAIVSIDTYVYDLDDLSLVKHLAGDIGYSGTAYTGQSAISDNYFLFDYSPIAGTPGFVVYRGTPVPEPSVATILLAGCVLLRRRPRAA